MYNIGIDMTTVSRIEKSCQKENFRHHVFTQAELDLFYTGREKPKFSSLAANFAAKENINGRNTPDLATLPVVNS